MTTVVPTGARPERPKTSPGACKRTACPETREERRRRLAWRRIGQLERLAGFTPVNNKRVNGAIMTQMVMLRSMGMEPLEAESEARRRVASRLAPRPMTRRPPRPSKSDDPDYRMGDGR